MVLLLQEVRMITCVQKMCGRVVWCLLLFPLPYGVTAVVKYSVKQEVNDHQYVLQKPLKELGK
jgi:hypothetical protein